MEQHKGYIGHLLTHLTSLDELLNTVRWIKKHIPLDSRYKGDDGEGLIISTIEYGLSNGYSWQEALSSFIPAKDGRFIMKGDLAKARILTVSGLEWHEETEGSVKDGTFVYTIQGSRDGNPFRRSFSIQEAINMKLYFPKGSNAAKDWFWQNFPERMCYFRALGFVARDFFGDVLKNIVLKEEYGDFGNPDSHVVEADGKAFNLGNAAEVFEEREKKVASLSTDRLKAYPVTEHETTPEPVEPEPKDEPIQTPEPQDTGEDRGYIEPPATQEIIETVQDSSVKEAMTYLEAELPEVVKYINQIPGRRTVPRIIEILEVYESGVENMIPFLTKTYGKKAVKGLEKSKGLEEDKVESGEEPVVTTEALNDPLPEAEHSLNWGDPEPGGGRTMMHATNLYMKLMNKAAVLGEMQKALEKSGDYNGDVEEALLKAPADYLETLYLACSLPEEL